MPVPLNDLVEQVKVSVNGAGGTLVTATDTGWENAIANGFWRAKLAGFFTGFRLDPDTRDITPLDSGDDDMEGDLQQLVIMFTAIEQLELAVVQLNSEFSAQSGEESITTKRSAQAITQILKQRRAELEALRTELVNNPSTSGYIGMADLIGIRLGALSSQATNWVT